MSLRTIRTIAWPRPAAPSTDWSRASIVIDDGASFALVRYLDVRQQLCGGLLWNLANGSVVRGEHIDLHRSGTRAVRRDATRAEVIDLANGRVVAKLGDRLDVALSPDAAFAVHRPRGDVGRKIVRATTRVHALAGGEPLELPARSVAEAFVDGGRLATVAERGKVTLWDLATGKASGTLPGLAKPASIRVAPSGTRIALSALDGQYAIYDLDAQKPVAKGKSKIIFNDDAVFDGTRYVGTNVLLDIDTGKAKSHTMGWLKAPRPSRAQTVVVHHPTVAVVAERSVLGDPVVELWNVDTAHELASIEIQPRAEAIACAGSTLAVAHLPADDEDWPALTVLSVA